CCRFPAVREQACFYGLRPESKADVYLSGPQRSFCPEGVGASLLAMGCAAALKPYGLRPESKADVVYLAHNGASARRAWGPGDASLVRERAYAFSEMRRLKHRLRGQVPHKSEASPGPLLH
ncbi:hypothetical protein A258_11962, partial [Pseudomonas syringae pv. actinidiae ICMP 19104]